MHVMHVSLLFLASVTVKLELLADISAAVPSAAARISIISIRIREVQTTTTILDPIWTSASLCLHIPVCAIIMATETLGILLTVAEEGPRSVAVAFPVSTMIVPVLHNYLLITTRSFTMFTIVFWCVAPVDLFNRWFTPSILNFCPVVAPECSSV